MWRLLCHLCVWYVILGHLCQQSLPCVIVYPLALSPSVMFHRLCHRLSSDCVNFRSLYYLSSSMSYYLICVTLCRVIYSSPVFSVCHRLYYVCVTFYPRVIFCRLCRFISLARVRLSPVPFSFTPWCIVHDDFSSRGLPSGTPFPRNLPPLN